MISRRSVQSFSLYLVAPRVTSVFAFCLLAPKFWEYGGYLQMVLYHSMNTCYVTEAVMYLNYLNFLRSQFVGILKHRVSACAHGPPCETFTTFNF